MRQVILAAALLLAIGCGSTEDEADGGAGGTGTGGSGGTGGTGGGPPPPPRCTPENPGGDPFDPSGSGWAPGSTAGDVTLDTDNGPLVFGERWTGCESWAFVIHSPPPANAEGPTYSDSLWASSIGELVRSRANLHLVLISDFPDATRDADLDSVRALAAQAEDVARARDIPEWLERIHVVNDRARDIPGFIGELASRGLPAFLVDRRQTIRTAGLLYLFPLEQVPNLEALSYEADYLDFEWTRDEALAAQTGVTVTPIFDAVEVQGDGFVEVALPAEIATADTLELDLRMTCTETDDNSPCEWDYLVYLWVCRVDETDTCDVEIGRWITPYARDGRWVHDVTPLLPYLRDGGTRRFKFYTQQKYELDLSMRLRTLNKGGVPVAAIPLWKGGTFNEEYNAGRQPIEVDIPADATRVELAAVISGHGFGDDAQNCAEFCNHTHHFTVNGAEFVKEHPETDDRRGCVKQIDIGVVPNQFGTWPFGRGGWCPGLEVEPWVVDVTANVTPGQRATISYRGLLEGEPYVWRAPAGERSNFPGRIDMESWLVIWK